MMLFVVYILLPSHQGGPTTVPCWPVGYQRHGCHMGISFQFLGRLGISHRPFWTNCAAGYLTLCLFLVQLEHDKGGSNIEDE
jgi:hypothetical protein